MLEAVLAEGHVSRQRRQQLDQFKGRAGFLGFAKGRGAKLRLRKKMSEADDAETEHLLEENLWRNYRLLPPHGPAVWRKVCPRGAVPSQEGVAVPHDVPARGRREEMDAAPATLAVGEAEEGGRLVPRCLLQRLVEPQHPRALAARRDHGQHQPARIVPQLQPRG